MSYHQLLNHLYHLATNGPSFPYILLYCPDYLHHSDYLYNVNTFCMKVAKNDTNVDLSPKSIYQIALVKYYKKQKTA